FNTPSSSTPSTTPITEPRPPRRLAPPITAAAITSSSRPTWPSGAPTPLWCANASTPAHPVSSPASVYTATLIPSTLRPHSRPVRRPAQPAGQHARGDAADRRRPRRTRPGEHLVVSEGGRHGRQRRHGADRQVDAAGDDDEEHAQHHHELDGVLVHDERKRVA